MSESLVRRSIIVQTSPERAFSLWVNSIHSWWPAGHSKSGDPDTKVIIEPRPGGRFFERATDGQEFEWGTVEVYDPPQRLVHTWYLGSGPDRPTRVEVTFELLKENRTQILVVHRGPELLGDLWPHRSVIFAKNWSAILAAFEQNI